MKSSEKHIEEAVRRGLRDTAVPKSLEPDAVLEILQSREAAEKPAPQRSTQRQTLLPVPPAKRRFCAG